jgi:hypothetical protein
MQPVQLSLMPELVAAPAVVEIGQLPEQPVAEAVTLLAALIAKAARPAVRQAGDE